MRQAARLLRRVSLWWKSAQALKNQARGSARLARSLARNIAFHVCYRYYSRATVTFNSPSAPHRRLYRRARRNAHKIPTSDDDRFSARYMPRILRRGHVYMLAYLQTRPRDALFPVGEKRAAPRLHPLPCKCNYYRLSLARESGRARRGQYIPYSLLHATR